MILTHPSDSKNCPAANANGSTVKRGVIMGTDRLGATRRTCLRRPATISLCVPARSMTPDSSIRRTEAISSREPQALFARRVALAWRFLWASSEMLVGLFAFLSSAGRFPNKPLNNRDKKVGASGAKLIAAPHFPHFGARSKDKNNCVRQDGHVITCIVQLLQNLLPSFQCFSISPFNLCRLRLNTAWVAGLSVGPKGLVR